MFLIGQAWEARALIELQDSVAGRCGAFERDSIVDLFVAILSPEKNINRLFAGHRFVIGRRNSARVAARIHRQDGLFKLVEGHMPFAAIGEELVTSLQVFVDQHDPGEFDSALGRYVFVVLDRLGATNRPNR